ncbi:MAG: hypothetical protein Q9227_005944 [Pyrenula ochraceoflavens]
MATSALSMLREPRDAYDEHVFRTIFKTNQSENSGKFVAACLEELLTMFIEMDEASAATESRVNLHYYCDDDRVDGSSRWELLPDPPVSERHKQYITQDRRPRWSQSEEGQYREYWDPLNDVRMGPTLGCQGNGILGKTYDLSPHMRPYPDYSPAMNRVTTTICDLSLSPIYFHDFDDLARNFNIGGITDTLNTLASWTAAVILHEFCHFPSWGLDDVKAPNSSSNAYLWQDVVDIQSPFASIQNINNVVFYTILARLKDLGWLISFKSSLVRQGRLYPKKTPGKR